MIESFKDPDVIAGPHERIVLNDLILKSKQAPDSEQHVVLIRFRNDLFVGVQHQIGDLENLNADSAIVRDLFLAQVRVPFNVQISRIQAELYSLGNRTHDLLIVDDDRPFLDGQVHLDQN